VSEVLGDQTSAIIKDAQRRMQQAEQDKNRAITTYLEGAEIDQNVTDMREMPDGKIMLEFEDDENEENQDE
jgi:hypothetical protein